MEEQIKAFIAYLHETKKTSGNTELSYRRDLYKLAAFLRERSVTEGKDITAVSLHEYVLFLEKSGFKAATISRNIASVRAFCHYLAGQGIVNAAVADHLKAPKVEKKRQDVLDQKELERLLAQPGKDKPIHVRDKAMLELLCATRLRVSELTGLKVQDVNLEMGYLISHDKKADRVEYFGERARRALEEYMENARERLLKEEKEQALFVNCSGTGMSRQGFWKLLKNYARAAQITKEITPQIFRYSVTGLTLPDRK